MRNSNNLIIEYKPGFEIKIFAKMTEPGRASDIANTYAFTVRDKIYIIDTSCGKKRFKEIRNFLKNRKEFDILCTHYHNDHIANNGRIAKKKLKDFIPLQCG